MQCKDRLLYQVSQCFDGDLRRAAHNAQTNLQTLNCNVSGASKLVNDDEHRSSLKRPVEGGVRVEAL